MTAADRTPERKAPPSHSLRLGASTPVLTLDGVMPAAYLAEGDRIVTRDGTRRLAAIRSRRLTMVPMLRITAGSLAHGLPGEDLLLPPDQPLLLRGARARLVYGREQVILPAFRLADGQFVRLDRVTEMQLCILRFDTPAVIFAADLQPVTRTAPQRIAA